MFLWRLFHGWSGKRDVVLQFAGDQQVSKALFERLPSEEPRNVFLLFLLFFFNKRMVKKGERRLPTVPSHLLFRSLLSFPFCLIAFHAVMDRRRTREGFEYGTRERPGIGSMDRGTDTGNTFRDIIVQVKFLVFLASFFCAVLFEFSSFLCCSFFNHFFIPPDF